MPFDTARSKVRNMKVARAAPPAPGGGPADLERGRAARRSAEPREAEPREAEPSDTERSEEEAREEAFEDAQFDLSDYEEGALESIVLEELGTGGGEIDPGGWPLYVSVLHEREREHRTLVVLARTFDYTCPRTGQEICVPITFETDFASIPSWARAVIPPFGRHAKAAVLHDWLYALGEPKKRGQADRMFRTAMGELNVPWLRRWVMWLAVRFGGGRAYGASREWLFSNPDTGRPCDPPFPNPHRPSSSDTSDTPQPPA